MQQLMYHVFYLKVFYTRKTYFGRIRIKPRFPFIIMSYRYSKLKSPIYQIIYNITHFRNRAIYALKKILHFAKITLAISGFIVIDKLLHPFLVPGKRWRCPTTQDLQPLFVFYHIHLINTTTKC